MYANSIQGRTHPPTPILSAILRLLSHLYGPLYACNNLKLVYLCTLEALEIKKLFDCEEKYRKKNNHFNVVCYWDFRDPPTLLYAISIQKQILIIISGALNTIFGWGVRG